MKKNKMMRTAAVLGVAALLTTSALSGTLAKYTTSTESTDNARVAVWGFNKDANVTLDLFDSSYKNASDVETVKANVKKDESNGDNLIAPGTTKTGTFSIINASTTAPEVKYKFTVSVNGSSIDDSIKKNKNIVWKLDNGNEGTWDALMTDILKLSGKDDVNYSDSTDSASIDYEPNKIPNNFATGKTHTISWEWKFNETNDETATYWVDKTANNVETKQPSDASNYTAMTQDQFDNYMGNKTTLDKATIKITVTATQID